MTAAAKCICICVALLVVGCTHEDYGTRVRQDCESLVSARSALYPDRPMSEAAQRGMVAGCLGAAIERGAR
jgi:hypothetical protein